MSMDVKEMTMKITTDSSGQVCATDPILLLSSSGIEGKRTLYKLVIYFLLLPLLFRDESVEGLLFQDLEERHESVEGSNALHLWI